MAANSLPEMTGAERASKADATQVIESQSDATWVILFGTDKEYEAHVSDIKQLIPGLALENETWPSRQQILARLRGDPRSWDDPRTWEGGGKLEAGPVRPATLYHNLRRFNDILDAMILVLQTEVVHRRLTVSADPPDGPDCREEVKRTERLCKGIAPLTTDLLCLLGEWDRRAGGSGSEVTGQDGR